MAAAISPPMDNPALRPGALLQESWDAIRAHPVALLLPMVILGLINGGGTTRSRYDFTWGTTPLAYLPFYAFLGLLALAIVILLFLAYTYASIMTAKAAVAATQQNREMDLGEAFREAGPLFVAGIGTFLLWAVIVLIGFVLLIVPGFVAMAGLLPIAGVLVQEGLQGPAALKRAWALTHGHRWSLFLAGGAIVLANIVLSALLSLLPLIGNALAGALGGACLAAGIVLSVCAYEHLRRDAPHHAGVVAPAAPMP